VTTIRWTDQAIADLAAICAFIQQDSPHYASVVVARLIRAVARLRDFPQSGRVVPEFDHHAAKRLPHIGSG
jgi:plasmid stabilization system protein ParE